MIVLSIFYPFWIEHFRIYFWIQKISFWILDLKNIKKNLGLILNLVSTFISFVQSSSQLFLTLKVVQICCNFCSIGSKLLTTQFSRQPWDVTHFFCCDCPLSLSTSSSSISHQPKPYPPPDHHSFLPPLSMICHHYTFHLCHPPHTNIEPPQSIVVHYHVTKDQIAVVTVSLFFFIKHYEPWHHLESCHHPPTINHVEAVPQATIIWPPQQPHASPYEQPA